MKSLRKRAIAKCHGFKFYNKDGMYKFYKHKKFYLALNKEVGFHLILEITLDEWKYHNMSDEEKDLEMKKLIEQFM